MRLLVILALLCMLAACTPSLSPLYNEADKLFDPNLLGVWKDADGSDEFIVVPRGDFGYRVLHTTGGRTEGFTARLVQLGSYRFVDLFPEARVSNHGFHNGHFVPAHTFGRIRLDGDRLTLALLDPEWCGDNAPEGIGYMEVEKAAVLAAPTAKLRAFALKFAETKAFGAVSEWVRKS